MSVTSLYPVLMSSDVAVAARFYRDELGFEVSFESDWYVSLRVPGRDGAVFELAILDRAHETIPAPFRAAVRGVLVNVEVDDVDAVHARLVGERGCDVALPLRDEAFGQRHFIVIAPDGVLVDVIQPIEPAPEFVGAYA